MRKQNINIENNYNFKSNTQIKMIQLITFHLSNYLFEQEKF